MTGPALEYNSGALGHRLQCMGTRKTATIFFGFKKKYKVFCFSLPKRTKKNTLSCGGAGAGSLLCDRASL